MSGQERGTPPGGLIVDLLGDIDRIGGRELRLKPLVALGEQLGVAEPTMRMTMARLRRRGWFEVRRQGRESVYRLTPTCLRALEEGRRRLFRPSLVPWTGEWAMVIYTVPETDRRSRDELRKQLVWHGFGPLAPSTWISAHPRLDEVANAAARLPAVRLTLLTTRTSGLAADRTLARRSWDLEELGHAYERFIVQLRMRLPDYERGAVDADTALAARIQLVHEYRRLVTGDPRLPPELQPAGWTGDEAQRLFDRAHALLAEASAERYAGVLVAA